MKESPLAKAFIAIPSVDMSETVVGIGTCSGADTDKFRKFGLIERPGPCVEAGRDVAQPVPVSS